MEDSKILNYGLSLRIRDNFSHFVLLFLARKGDDGPDLGYGLLAPREQLLVQHRFPLQDAPRPHLEQGDGSRENLQRITQSLRVPSGT